MVKMINTVHSSCTAFLLLFLGRQVNPSALPQQERRILLLPIHLPALLHQPGVGEGPHDPHREDHDDDEGQEELGDGEKEQL